MALHRIAAADELPPGSLRHIEVSGRQLCLAHVPDEGFFAIDDMCTHEQALLSDGELIGCEVECPEHFSRFDLRTGAVNSLPAMDPSTVYEVSVESDGAIFVELDDASTPHPEGDRS